MKQETQRTHLLGERAVEQLAALVGVGGHAVALVDEHHLLAVVRLEAIVRLGEQLVERRGQLRTLRLGDALAVLRLQHTAQETGTGKERRGELRGRD